MNAEPQVIQDDAPGGKYFHYMLNMADDDLDVYEYRLLGHYRPVCGGNNVPCTETVRETAEKIKGMSAAKASTTRRELAEKGWIVMKPGKGKAVLITLVDRMLENIQRFALCSPHEQPPVSCSPHEQPPKSRSPRECAQELSVRNLITDEAWDWLLQQFTHTGHQKPRRELTVLEFEAI